jgi:flagellar motor switch protein FliN/FliY
MSEEHQTPATQETPDEVAAVAQKPAAAGAGETATAADEAAAGQGGDGVERAKFNSINNDKPLSAPIKENSNLDFILDIPVTISMEIGRARISIRNLLQLNQGSVVELDRLAGEPMDVLVNGTLVAHGEVVVVNEKFGIRLTDVVSPAERVKKLK